jgi:hypothetical protein
VGTIVAVLNIGEPPPSSICGIEFQTTETDGFIGHFLNLTQLEGAGKGCSMQYKLCPCLRRGFDRQAPITPYQSL